MRSVVKTPERQQSIYMHKVDRMPSLLLESLAADQYEASAHLAIKEKS